MPLDDAPHCHPEYTKITCQARKYVQYAVKVTSLGIAGNDWIPSL